MKSSILSFDLKTGLSPGKKPLQRFTSQMKDLYHDTAEITNLINHGDPLVYEYYDLGIEPTEKNLAYGTTMLSPGKVGNEFFMTKGHFHYIPDTAEIYYCLSGYGLILMENQYETTEYQLMHPGDAVSIPGNYAHRAVNLSATEKLVFFFTLRADAGHDYITIEKKGFRKLVIDNGKGGFAIADNPSWNT